MGSEKTARDDRHSVWGRVVDAGGGPVPTAEVFWVAATDAETVGLFDVHKVAQADADGRFWAPGLPPGPCLLVADFQRLGVVGDQVRVAHGTRLSIPYEGEPVLVFPHRRTDFGRIVGTVTDAIDGRPASRLPVALLADGADKPLRQVETTTSGGFEFAWLRAGKYQVAVWGTARQLEGSAPLELKQNGRIDVQIQLHRRPPGPRGRVQARVLGRLGVPISAARVNVVLPNIHVPPKKTGHDGTVEFTDLPARPERIVAMAAGHWPGGVLVQPGAIEETIGAEITLEPTARLRVEVLDATTGKPLRHANLLVTHAGGDYWSWGGVLPPPDAPPQDHHDVEVRLGPVTVRAASPGFETAEAHVDVAAEDDAPPVVLRLARRR